MQSSVTSASISPANPAVQRCMEAGRKAYEQERSKGAKECDADRAARVAFRNAMPHLSGEQNIQDFIACIALAVLKGFMYDSEVSKLLYAAQVATGALVRQPAARRSEPKPAASSAPKPPAAEPAREPSQEASQEANAA